MAWGATIKVPALDPVILGILLEALTACNRHLMRQYRVPPLYASGVRYQAEPPGQENWLTAPVILVEADAKDDCEGLACWRAAELQLAGEDAKAVGMSQPLVGGGTAWHIQVQRPSGIEDPSVILGMR